MADTLGERMDRLEKGLGELQTAVDEIHDAIVGSIRAPGGLAVVVQRHEREIAAIHGELSARTQLRQQIVDGYEKRVSELEDWRSSLRNRAIGIGIGVALGSAGIGATVGAVVSSLFGGG